MDIWLDTWKEEMQLVNIKEMAIIRNGLFQVLTNSEFFFTRNYLHMYMLHSLTINIFKLFEVSFQK